MKIIAKAIKDRIHLEIGVDFIGEEELSLHIERSGSIVVLGIQEVNFLHSFIEENRHLLLKEEK